MLQTILGELRQALTAAPFCLGAVLGFFAEAITKRRAFGRIVDVVVAGIVGFLSIFGTNTITALNPDGSEVLIESVVWLLAFTGASVSLLALRLIAAKPLAPISVAGPAAAGTVPPKIGETW